MNKTYPKTEWEVVDPEDVAIDSAGLTKAKTVLEEKLGEAKYRVAVVRAGLLAAEWVQGMDCSEKVHIASANKSILSSTLGIAIAEGRINSADDLATDYYPELMDVPEGAGPKEGRWAFAPNAGITLRHLICNVSGYMKPGEEPGQVFNYQTNGMCILSHCIEKAYWLYDVNDPEGSPKISTLYKEKIADVIGVDWGYCSGSQEMHDNARINIFGWGSAIRTDLRDLARLGWLWCNGGEWDGQQVIPQSWMHEVTAVAPDILANGPQEVWKYGHGFWTNAEGKLWPEFPTEGFTAWGAGGHYVIVFPSFDLVVVMNPTPFPGASQPYETHTVTWLHQQEALTCILDACR